MKNRINKTEVIKIKNKIKQTKTISFHDLTSIKTSFFFTSTPILMETIEAFLFT